MSVQCIAVTAIRPNRITTPMFSESSSCLGYTYCSGGPPRTSPGLSEGVTLRRFLSRIPKAYLRRASNVTMRKTRIWATVHASLKAKNGLASVTLAMYVNQTPKIWFTQQPLVKTMASDSIECKFRCIPCKLRYSASPKSPVLRLDDRILTII